MLNKKKKKLGNVLSDLKEKLEEFDKDFHIHIKQVFGFPPFWKTEIELDEYNSNKK